MKLKKLTKLQVKMFFMMPSTKMFIFSFFLIVLQFSLHGNMSYNYDPYDYYSQGYWMHAPYKQGDHYAVKNVYQFKDLERYFYNKYREHLNLEHVMLGAFAGLFVSFAIFKNMQPKPEDIVDLTECKEDQSPRLCFDERLEFLKNELKDCDTRYLNMPMVACLTQGYSKIKLEKFIQVLKRHATEYEIDFMHKKFAGIKLERHYPLEMAHVTMALEDISCGTKVFYEQDKEDILNTAIHEAGHAVAIVKSDNTILHYISMIHRSKSNGRNHFFYRYESDSLSCEDYKDKIIIDLCGGIAEQVFGFDKNWYKQFKLEDRKMPRDASRISKGFKEFLLIPGVGQDLKDAQQAARCIVEQQMNLFSERQNYTQEEIEDKIFEILDECYQKAVLFIKQHRDEVEKIAQRLMRVDILQGDEVYELCGVVRPLYSFEMRAY